MVDNFLGKKFENLEVPKNQISGKTDSKVLKNTKQPFLLRFSHLRLSEKPKVAFRSICYFSFDPWSHFLINMASGYY